MSGNAPSVAIIIPFRDRGGDPRRKANLEYVLRWWRDFGAPVIVATDGQTGDAQFNRSAAYNRGAADSDAQILVYIESDMVLDYGQIHEAVVRAAERPGLVVPFTRQHKLTEIDSIYVRTGRKQVSDCQPGPHPYGETGNYGCVNVLSRTTLEAVGGWDEQFSGNAHDDCAMWLAFDMAAGLTHWVDGDAYHLYHLEAISPGAPRKDKEATERNYRRMQLYTQARTAEEIRHLTNGGMGLRRNWRGELA